MAIGTLSIDVEARLAGLEAGMDRASRIAAQNVNRIEREFASLRTVGAGIAGTLAAAFSVGVLRQFITATADSIDRLNDLQAATGGAIPKLSALVDIGARTGTSFETVSASLIKFNGVLKDAKSGSVQERVLRSIGLSAAELRKQDPADALQQVAIALTKYEDDGNRARIVQELFGKSTRDVSKYLRDLAEAGKLTGSITTEQAKRAEEFNNQLAAMGANAAGAARRLVSDFLPAMNQILQAFNDRGLQAALDKFGNLAFDWENTQARKQLKIARDDLEDLRKQRAALTDNLGGALKQAFLGVTPEGLDTKILAREAEIRRLNNTLFNSKAGGGRGSVNLPFTPGSTQLLETAGDISGLKTETDARKRITPADNKALSDALQTLERTDIAKLTELNARLTELFNLQRETRGAPAVAEAIKATNDEIDKLLNKDVGPAILDPREQIRSDFLRSEKAAYEEVTEQVKQLDEMALQAARNIQDALGDTLSRTLKGDFDSIGDLWKNLLVDMVAQALSAKLGQALLGDFAKTGDVGGLLGNALNFFVGSFAVGTDYVPRTGLALIHRGERIVTADDNRRGSWGQSTATQFVYSPQIGMVGSGVSRGEFMAGLAQVHDQTMAEVRQLMLRMGVRA